MEIRFQFDLPKAVQAMTYLVDRLGHVDKVKLMKLVYFADRDHFIRHGYPITGDAPFAMKHGPVPSACLDVLDAEYGPEGRRVFEYLHVDDYMVIRRLPPDEGLLAGTERRVLDEVLREHGGKETWALVAETHDLPEYKQFHRPGTSTPIPFEALLRLYADESRFRKGRPVITKAMAAHMPCPFPQSEPTL